MHLPQLMNHWRAAALQTGFRVVAFGSSNTEIGWHSEGRHGWPCWLACILRASVGRHIQLLNAGIGGDTAIQLRQRIDRDVLPIQPHLTLITIGGNDHFQRHSLADFEANLHQLEARLRQAGSLVVFQTYYALLPEADQGFAAYMDVVRRVAHATGAGLVDQFAWFAAWQIADPATYRTIMRDGGHLNPIGNALFGTLAGRVFGCADPVVPADLPTGSYLPALERHGAPARVTASA